MKSTIRLAYIFMILVMPVLPGFQAEAQEMIDARSLALAGSNVATAEGLEYLGGNPATLAGPKDFGFEFLLFSSRLKISNNSFSLKEYDDYFTSGDTLTNSDIDNLLEDLPDSGLRLDGLAGVRALSFCFHSFGFGVTGTGNGYVIIPKEAVEFPFYGNSGIKNLRFDDLDGEGWGGVAFDMGYARKIIGEKDDSRFLSAGVNLKYILGLAYGGLIDADGGLQTTDEYIYADGKMSYKTSMGGRGFAADMGFLAKIRKNWTVSLHFNNLIGGIGWDKDNEISVYEFQSDTLRIGDGGDTEITDTDTTYSTGNFSTSLPRTMNMAASFSARDNLVLTAAWRQGLDHSMGNTVTPRVSLGAEYSRFSYLPLRAAFAFGGRETFAVGLGLGINVKCWRLDIGYLNHTFNWFRSAKSVDLAVTSHLRF